MSSSVKKSSINTVTLERLFIFGLLILSALLIADYIFVSDLLRKQYGNLDHKRIELKTEELKQKKIKELGEVLQGQKQMIEKTRLTMGNIGISSDFESRTKVTDVKYENATFQEQFIYDAHNYAQRVGISITSITFPTDTSGVPPGTEAGSTSGAATTPPPSTTSSGTATPTSGVQTPTTQVPSIVQATKIQIEFGEDQKISYDAFLDFLRMLENNNIRMSIESLKLQPDEDSPNLLQQVDLELTIYSRKK